MPPFAVPGILKAILLSPVSFPLALVFMPGSGSAFLSVRGWPVRRQLIVGTATVALITLAVSLAVGVWTSWLRESARANNELTVTAGLLAVDLARDVPRGGRLGQTAAAQAQALQQLARLQTDPAVHSAQILRNEAETDKVLVQWQRQTPAPVGDRRDIPVGARADFGSYAKDLLEVKAPVVRQGLPLGTLVLKGYKASLWSIARNDLIWSLPGIGVALLFSLLLGVPLAASIMRPMRQLASAARAAGRDGDYSVRLPLPGDPNLAAVAREFNQMADLMGQRDAMLEGKVRERTAALEAARVAADAANQAKTRFLAMMSHEIRTPLHGVIGSAEVLAGAQLAARDAEHLKHISHSAQALQRIVDDVLDLTGLDSGRLPLLLAEAAPSTVLRQAAAPHAEAALAKGLQWQLNLTAACDEPRRLDAKRLSQALNKLFSNAVKFTESGQVVVQAHIDSAQRLVVSIEDSGEGFDMADLPRLLRPFEQAQSSAARRHEGSGLGLAIAQHYGDLMGASLTFDSAPGRGTHVRFSLLAPRAVGPAHAGTEATRQASATPAGLYLDPILVVEDNEVNQFVITAMLERLGAADVQVASSGAQALQMAEQAPYQLVLMDWQMPEMDGLEAIARLRAKEAATGGARRVPIVAVTANAMAGDKERCLQAGADGYLSKPLRLDDLRDALTQFYRGRQGPAPADAGSP
jgi:two-component system, sensor histidine kinase